MKQNISTIIPKISSSQFYWNRWRAGSSKSFGIPTRKKDLTLPLSIRILRTHGVGWCHSEDLPCRAKKGQFAVMCFDPKTDEHFWFHLRNDEFLTIYEDK